MRFSILISTMGGDKLKAALSSIEIQEFKDYEIILVVDNPNFNIESFLDDNFENEFLQKINILKNEINIGLTRSLNIGLAFANGEIISRLDDDDEFSYNRLDLVDTEFRKDDSVGVVTGGASVILDDESTYTLKIPSSHKKIASGLERRNILVHSSFNVKKELLLELNGYNEMCYYAQDYELYLRLLNNGIKFSGLDILSKRYETKSSITLSKRRQQALFSLSALCLYHANNWQNNKALLPIVIGFIRFVTPSWTRAIVRYLRKIRKNVSYYQM